MSTYPGEWLFIWKFDQLPLSLCIGTYGSLFYCTFSIKSLTIWGKIIAIKNCLFGYATSELNATTTTMEMRKQGKQTICRTLFGMFPCMVNIVKLDLNLNTNAIITYFNKNLLDHRFINGYPLDYNFIGNTHSEAHRYHCSSFTNPVKHASH